MTGVEIDFVAADSLKALSFYETIFEVKRIEVTDFPPGQNEAVFSIYDVRFHMLDENPEFGLLAPSNEHRNTIWFNVMVPDIQLTHNAALDAGCTEIQAVKRIDEFGVSNSMFTDPFGYVWMLHEMHRVVGFEERMEFYKDN